MLKFPRQSLGSLRNNRSINSWLLHQIRQFRQGGKSLRRIEVRRRRRETGAPAIRADTTEAGLLGFIPVLTPTPVHGVVPASRIDPVIVIADSTNRRLSSYLRLGDIYVSAIFTPLRYLRLFNICVSLRYPRLSAIRTSTYLRSGFFCLLNHVI